MRQFTAAEQYPHHVFLEIVISIQTLPSPLPSLTSIPSFTCFCRCDSLLRLNRIPTMCSLRSWSPSKLSPPESNFYSILYLPVSVGETVYCGWRVSPPCVPSGRDLHPNFPRQSPVSFYHHFHWIPLVLQAFQTPEKIQINILITLKLNSILKFTLVPFEISILTEIVLENHKNNFLLKVL